MGYQTVRALRPIQHDKVVRIPGQTTGVNAQDFVVSDSQAAALVALGAVTAQGAAAAPGSTRSPVVFRTFADVTALNAYLTSSGQTAVNGDTAYLGADDASAEPWDLVASVWTKRGSGSASSTPVPVTADTELTVIDHNGRILQLDAAHTIAVPEGLGTAFSCILRWPVSTTLTVDPTGTTQILDLATPAGSTATRTRTQALNANGVLLQSTGTANLLSLSGV